MPFGAWVWLAACADPETGRAPAHEPPGTEQPGTEQPPVDADRDGAVAAEDCDDADPARHPGADERCDGLDDDCDGIVDEEPIDGVPAYDDGDGDGVGSGDVVIVACEVSPGLVTATGDCDDGSAEIGPQVAERCDGIDDDCDPSTTEEGLVTVGDRTYDDLQDALDAADEGDVLTICDGTYAGAFELPAADLTLRSLNGAATTVLAGDGTGPVLHARGDLVLEGLTITGGRASAATTGGGGLSASGVSATLTDCVFEDNEHVHGGAIELSDGALVATGTEFRGNRTTDGVGGAVSVVGSSMSCDGCVFADNAAGGSWGGAAIFADVGAFELTDAEVTGNRSAGAAVQLTADAFTVADSVFSDNVGGSDGGAMWLVGDGTISDSRFERNVASRGGAIGTIYAQVRLERVELLDNRATDSGGALYPWISSTLDLVDSAVLRNTADAGGGALYWYNPVTVRSTSTDWGSGADDNAPTDFRFSFTDSAAPAGDFVCNGGGRCG